MLESIENVGAGFEGEFSGFVCPSRQPSDGGDELKHTGVMVQSDIEGEAAMPHTHVRLSLLLFCCEAAPAKAEVLFRDLQICQQICPCGPLGQGVAISLSQEDKLCCRQPLLCCIISAFVGLLTGLSEFSAGFLNILQALLFFALVVIEKNLPVI